MQIESILPLITEKNKYVKKLDFEIENNIWYWVFIT